MAQSWARKASLLEIFDRQPEPFHLAGEFPLRYFATGTTRVSSPSNPLRCSACTTNESATSRYAT